MYLATASVAKVILKILHKRIISESRDLLVVSVIRTLVLEPEIVYSC